MKSRHAKVLLVTGKCLIAVALLVWAVGQVHWNDWVRDRQGRTYAVQAAPRPGGPAEFQVVTGWLWWKQVSALPAGQLKPLPAAGPAAAAYVHDGLASSLTKVQSRLGLVALAALATLVSYFVMAYRWQLLLNLQEIRIGLWEIVRLTFLGLFFNVVVPGTVGGDLVKAYYAARHSPRKGSVLISVVIDRVLGLLTLTLLAGAMLCTLVWFMPRTPEITQAIVAVLVIAAAVGAGLLLLFSTRFRSLLHVQKLYCRMPLAHRIASMGQVVRLYRSRPGGLMAAAATALVSHGLWIGGLGLLGYCLNLGASWYEYYLYLPLVYTIGAVPLTPGGVGLIEKLFVVFFAASNPSQVLALALLARLLPVLLSLPGLVVAVTGAKIPPRDVLAAELGSDTRGAPPGK
jgi:uncharacterized protein (TIRG00374 family)